MQSICVVNNGVVTSGTTSSCDRVEHMASSGVSMVEWTGGNMPNTEENVYSYVNKKSSFTVIAFTILTFAVTWGLAAALSGVCLLYTSPSPRDGLLSRMPSSA